MACTCLVRASYSTANTSPPSPHEPGRVKPSTAAVAIAASNAVPPAISTRSPATAAAGDADATIPFDAYLGPGLGSPAAHAGRVDAVSTASSTELSVSCA